MDIGAFSSLVRDRNCSSVSDYNFSALVAPNVDNSDILNSMSKVDEFEILNGSSSDWIESVRENLQL